jgi:hypothetical protein
MNTPQVKSNVIRDYFTDNEESPIGDRNKFFFSGWIDTQKGAIKINSTLIPLAELTGDLWNKFEETALSFYNNVPLSLDKIYTIDLKSGSLQ